MKISPCLWFDKEALPAANFYVEVFKKGSKVLQVDKYDEESSKVAGQPVGSVLTVLFKLSGQEFLALNGGPLFKFSEAVSFIIDCKDQKEVDYFWEKLTADGGEESQCGWLKDKYGLSWQVVPEALTKMMKNKNKTKVKRMLAAMYQMQKIDLPALEKAFKGK